MSSAMLAHYFGGWSDAIHWGAMEPRIRITPLGDVHIDQSFVKTVYEPFGRVGGTAQVTQAIDAYDQLYSPMTERPSFAELVEPEFLKAWESEFGISLDHTRDFVDDLETLGTKPARPIIEISRSDLVQTLASIAAIDESKASAALSRFALMPRPKWRVVGDSWSDKDWFPWRFRRRLSLIRKPLLQIEPGDDATLVVAPGLFRESFQAIVHWFYRGQIPQGQARSSEMSKWIGHANNVQRSKFNMTVADRMRELGWQAEPELKLTKIFGRSFDRDYGDIDVLAWRPENGRVLAMECKDLHYLKTLGEVAEQLNDFRGSLRPNGKPDHLKRHLDRLEILRANEEPLALALRLTPPIRIEGQLVFKNPVPMQFAWNLTASSIKLSIFSNLDQL